MQLVIFGLTVSSSWGNGHATLWRGLIRALGARGHQVTFFERDVPYYAAHRDLTVLDGGTLVLYPAWATVRRRARHALRAADAAIVTSYCPDARDASTLVIESPARVKAFYDLDTGVTLDRLHAGVEVDYLPPQGLADFDLVLSYIGGGALEELRGRLGARRVAPLYGSVDPAVHAPVPPRDDFRADLSYLGTFAADRQDTLERFFLEPARRLRARRFFMGGAQYPDGFPWTENLFFRPHVPPAEHPAFYCSSRLTLNVTRRAMAAYGWCPSGRFFEAAACGTPVLTDSWAGMADFFEPEREVLVANSTEEAMAALSMPDHELRAMGARARERALAHHSAAVRARELEAMLG